MHNRVRTSFVIFSLCCRLVTEKKPEEDSLVWALFLVSIVAGKCVNVVIFSLCCRLVTEKKPEEDSLVWALFLVSIVAGKCVNVDFASCNLVLRSKV